MIETAFLGVIVSGLIQWIKAKGSPSNKGVTLAILAGLSFIVAIVMYILQHYNLWEAFLGIIASASTVYAFILQHFEDTPTV